MNNSSIYNFISSEWYKLIRSRFFYVCTLTNAAISALVIFSVKISGGAYRALAEQISGKARSSTAVLELLELVKFSEEGNPAWAAAYSFSNLGLIIGAILVILFLSMEYKKGTMLILIGRGYSRKKLILAKIIVAGLGMGMMEVVTTVVAFVTGITIWGFPKETVTMVPDMFFSFGCNLILSAGCLAPAIILAVLLQNSGEAIGAYVVGNFLLSNAASIGIDYGLVSDRATTFLFLSNKIAKISNIFDSSEIPWTEMGISICYVALSVVACCYLIERKDLN